MILLIPLLNTSPNNYAELRYSLRTMERNLPVTSLTLVGGLPKWCKPDKHIPHQDATRKSRKEENIRDKVLAGMPNEPFLFANDDHFVMQQYDVVPNLYSTEFGGNGGYLQTVFNMRFPRNFDVHFPIVFNPLKFQSICGDPWPEWGYCMKSMYAAFAGLPGTLTADHKLRTWQPDIPWFSTYDGCFNNFRPHLQKLFPTPSRWER